MAHVYNPNGQRKAEAGGLSGVGDQSRLQNETLSQKPEKRQNIYIKRWPDSAKHCHSHGSVNQLQVRNPLSWFASLLLG